MNVFCSEFATPASQLKKFKQPMQLSDLGFPPKCYQSSKPNTPLVISRHYILLLSPKNLLMMIQFKLLWLNGSN